MPTTDEGQKFLFVFAGPNGSGKSSLTEQVRSDPRVPFPPADHYINPDVIARELPPGNPVDVAKQASAEAERRRKLFLSRGESFAFETVLPHPSRLSPLLEAKERDYNIGLHFVGTDSPEINAGRVGIRVAEGGHDVPRDRIPDRYDRAMRLLPRATEIANLSYIYDNSGDRKVAGSVPSFRPLMRLYDGQLERMGVTPAWMESALGIPHAERAASRQALSNSAAAQGVTLESADELRGNYRGRIDIVSRHYIVQRTAVDKAVVHDRAVLEIGAGRTFQRGQPVAIQYAGGVAAAKDLQPQLVRPSPSRGKGPER